jgi:hypothetical protein
LPSPPSADGPAPAAAGAEEAAAEEEDEDDDEEEEEEEEELDERNCGACLASQGLQDSYAGPNSQYSGGRPHTACEKESRERKDEGKRKVVGAA